MTDLLTSDTTKIRVIQSSTKQKYYIIFIIRLSAKGTDGVMKPTVFRTFSKFVTIPTECSVYYRTRGGEWWGCIAATPHIYMVRSSVKASTIGANK